jgi:hypothetical protein
MISLRGEGALSNPQLGERTTMKSMSPWFQMVSLLDGIRKTISKIEANRSDSESMNHRTTSTETSKSQGQSARGAS